MLPVPLLFPRLQEPSSDDDGGGGGAGGSEAVGLGSVSWKAAGSGSGRRLRIREAKDSLEASVLMSRTVGGMVLGSWAGLEGVDVGGGVGGRGRKKGIFRGDSSGDVGVLCGSAETWGEFAVVSSTVLLLEWESSAEGSVAVAALVTLVFFESSAICEASFVAALSDEADTDT